MENVNRIKGEIEKLYNEEASINADIQKAVKAVQKKNQPLQAENAINETKENILILKEKMKNRIRKENEITKVHKNFFDKEMTFLKII